MNSDQQTIIKRIRRKAERMVLDTKNSNQHHDAKEILALIDLLEKSQ